MMRKVKADKFNTAGKFVREVEVAANRVENVIYIHIQDGPRTHSFAMAATAWDELAKI